MAREKLKAPTPEACCPKCEAIARAHGWTETSGMSVRAYMDAHGLKEDAMQDDSVSDEKLKELAQLPLDRTELVLLGHDDLPLDTIRMARELLKLRESVKVLQTNVSVFYTHEQLEAQIAEMRKVEPLMRHFRFAHLRSETMKNISRIFANAALQFVRLMRTGSAERTIGLRNLMSAKDNAVRCQIDLEEGA